MDVTILRRLSETIAARTVINAAGNSKKFLADEKPLASSAERHVASWGCDSAFSLASSVSPCFLRSAVLAFHSQTSNPADA